MGELQQVEHDSCCRILDALQRFDRGGRESSQERVAVVEAGDDKCLDQELCCFPCEEGLDPVDVESKSAGSGHRVMLAVQRSWSSSMTPRFLAVKDPPQHPQHLPVGPCEGSPCSPRQEEELSLVESLLLNYYYLTLCEIML